MTVSEDIEECTNCLDNGLVSSDRLKTDPKPFVEFSVEKKWKPDGVTVLFIAESPPCNGKQRYFYNARVAEKKTNLRQEVLSRLGLERLEDFREEGCFLIDTIKCRLCKPIKKKTLYELARTCSRRFLLAEIDQLKPKIIFVLGDAARYALSQTADFEELDKHKITDEFDEYLSAYRVILSPFPGGQTRRWTDEIDRAFAKILSC